MHSSLAVANRFLELAGQREDSVTPMKLLKLVYLAHGWMLGLHGRPLISDHVEAWRYGPVIPVLYNAARRFRNEPISHLFHLRPVKFDEAEADIIRQTYEIYGHKTGPALSRLTHMPGGPWETVYEHGRFGTVIPNDLIEDHYRQLAARAPTNA